MFLVCYIVVQFFLMEDVFFVVMHCAQDDLLLMWPYFVLPTIHMGPHSPRVRLAQRAPVGEEFWIWTVCWARFHLLSAHVSFRVLRAANANQSILGSRGAAGCLWV